MPYNQNMNAGAYQSGTGQGMGQSQRQTQQQRPMGQMQNQGAMMNRQNSVPQMPMNRNMQGGQQNWQSTPGAPPMASQAPGFASANNGMFGGMFGNMMAQDGQGNQSLQAGGYDGPNMEQQRHQMMLQNNRAAKQQRMQGPPQGGYGQNLQQGGYGQMQQQPQYPMAGMFGGMFGRR